MSKFFNKNKKIIIIIFALAVFFACLIYFYCGYNKAKSWRIDAETKTNILEHTWEQLSASEQYEIEGGWQSGTVTMRVFEPDSEDKVKEYFLEDKYFNRSVYLVVYPSKNSALMGDIKKIVDPDTYSVVGGYFRE